MDISAIASASIDMKLAQTQQSAQLAVLKKAMDADSNQALTMIEDMQSAQPAPGHLLDIKV